MSNTSRLTPSWRGYFRIKKFMVFGDSYSHVGYNAQAPVPTRSSPLGVALPGQPITKPGHPNWVGYLIRDHGHGHANMIAYDYACRGDAVTGVYTNQVSRESLPTVGRKPGSRTLYTNNKAEITPIIATLFAARDALYQAGARNFLFIGVPPLGISPIAWEIKSSDLKIGMMSYDVDLSTLRRPILTPQSCYSLPGTRSRGFYLALPDTASRWINLV